MRWPHSALRRLQPIRVWQEPTSVCSPRIHAPRFYLVLIWSFVIPEYVSFVLSKDTLAGFHGQEQNARSFPGGLSLLPALQSLYSGFYCHGSDLKIQEACSCSGSFESHLSYCVATCLVPQSLRLSLERPFQPCLLHRAPQHFPPTNPSLPRHPLSHFNYRWLSITSCPCHIVWTTISLSLIWRQDLPL